MHQPMELDPRDASWDEWFDAELSPEYWDACVSKDCRTSLGALAGIRPLLGRPPGFFEIAERENQNGTVSNDC